MLVKIIVEPATAHVTANMAYAPLPVGRAPDAEAFPSVDVTESVITAPEVRPVMLEPYAPPPLSVMTWPLNVTVAPVIGAPEAEFFVRATIPTAMPAL